MTRVILITFGVLGWAWFEMSGGSSFVPGENGVQVIAMAAPVEAAPVKQAPSRDVVARDTPADLNTVAVAAPPTEPRPDQVRTIYVSAKPEIRVEPEKLAMLENAVVMSDATPASVIDASVVESAIADAVDYRRVTGSRVNLRGGPSTSYDVVTQLLRDEEVEILDETGDGWVKLRALDGNNIGWMAESFLTASN